MTSESYNFAKRNPLNIKQTDKFEIFINELPDNKKIRTYAKQKPVRLKRRLLTVEVDYENLFANGKKQLLNVDNNDKRQRSKLKEITNTVKSKRKGANYRRTERRGGLQRLLKEKNQEMDLVKQVTECNKSCKDKDDGGTSAATLNAAEKALDQKANDSGDDVNVTQENSQHKHKDEEQPITNNQDAIISSIKEHESIKATFFVDTISPSPSNCFLLPTTSTPIQREKDRKVTDFNLECTPIVCYDNRMEKTDKLNEHILQTPVEKTDKLNQHILQAPVQPTDDKEMLTCLLVAPVTITPKVNSINTISHVVRIKKLSCIPLDVLIL